MPTNIRGETVPADSHTLSQVTQSLEQTNQISVSYPYQNRMLNHFPPRIVHASPVTNSGTTPEPNRSIELPGCEIQVQSQHIPTLSNTKKPTAPLV